MNSEEMEDSTLKCIFCGRKVSPEDAVRYRGALAHRECALAQEPVKEFKETPFYMLAAVGCLIGLVAALYITLHALQYAYLGPSAYLPPLVLYLTAFMLSIPLQSLGLLALNRVELQEVGVLSLAIGIVSTGVFGASLYDRLVTGPYFLLEEMILPKGYTYYGWAVILYILFLGVAGIGIMLYVGRTKIQNTTVAAVGLYLLMAGLVPFGYTMPPVGFVHALLYAAAFVFFFTREDTVEREPVETLDYSNIRAE